MARVSKITKAIAKICLVEGETEFVFIKSLYIARIKSHKFNPWEHQFRKISAKINIPSIIYIVLDMDKITLGMASHAENIEACKEKLLNNLLDMSKNKNIRQIVLLKQYYSLEDEIREGLLFTTQKQLYSFFDVEGISEIKRIIISLGYEKLKLKLESGDFNLNKLWQRHHDEHTDFLVKCCQIHKKIIIGNYQTLIED